MSRTKQFYRVLLALCVVAMTASPPAFAQSSFRTVAQVGDQIVTGYEVQQRIIFLEVQNAQGDLAKRALEELIDERLRAIALSKTNISVSTQELQNAIEEIASRTDRSAAEFLNGLAGQGVDPVQFRKTTELSIAWRKYVQQRFGPAARATEAEVDRELGLAVGRGLVEVRFAEIFLPMNTERNISISQQLAPQIATLTTNAEFSDAARRFSVGATKDNGGLVDGWTPITNIPPEIREELINMRPGQVTSPIEFSGAIGLFQLRGIREASSRRAASAIDFMTYRIPFRSGRDPEVAAMDVIDQIDSCNDLYGIARNDPEDFLTRQTLTPANIERIVASQLEQLDANESAVVAGDNGTLRVVTLCARLPVGVDVGDDVDRDAIRLQISNRKLNALAEALIQDLRGETVIRRR